MPLLHQAVVRELADRRAGTHDTKGRSEVSGGGKKPWKQKGTGRARQGSIRATQWKGGGKPFGPTPRSYDKRCPREMRREALRAAVAAKARGRRAGGGGAARRSPTARRRRWSPRLTGARGRRACPRCSCVVASCSDDARAGRAQRAVARGGDARATCRCTSCCAARGSCSSGRRWSRSRRRSGHEGSPRQC